MLSAKKIPAGEKGQIEAIIKTQNLSGPVEKVITVTTNDPRHKTVNLSIKGVIEPEIAVSESSISFDNLPAGKEARKWIILTIPAAKPIRILSAASMDSNVSVQLEPVPHSNGKKVRLAVIRKAKVKPGYHFGQIILKTDSRLTPELLLYVAGTAR